MKKIYALKTLLVLAAASLMSLSSCMEAVDLNNLSTDMQLGGKLAVPVGSTEFTIKDLLERYEQDTSIHVGIGDGDVVMLYVENIMTYQTPDLSDKFSALTQDVMAYSIETKPLNLADVGFDFQVAPTQGAVIAQDTTMTFDFNNLNNDSEQEINSLLFRKTDIKVTVNTYGKTYPEGFLVITLQLPGTNDSIVIDASKGSFVEPKQNLKVLLNKEQTTEYSVKFKITGDGTTTIATNDRINIAIAFTNSDYIVYGYFYYNDGKKQMQPYSVDLFSYLPEGCDLRFFAPSFKFDVSSNIGIPFIFDIDTIISHEYGESDPKYVSVSLSENNVIARADSLGDLECSSIAVDKTSFPDGNASSIFNTKLTSIGASFSFRAPEIGNSLAAKEQFISSDSRLTMTANAQLPIWLDAGSVVAYADTLDGIDIEDYDYITDAKLLFAYTSYLPMGFAITITLLDEQMNPIAVAEPDKYAYEIKAAPVDGDGGVIQSNPTQGEFSIEYKNDVISDLKKAKHLVVNVKAKGATPGSKIKITNNDKLSIKVGLRTEGGLTVDGFKR
jgi:hypothetical protein